MWNSQETHKYYELGNGYFFHYDKEKYKYKLNIELCKQ